MADVNGDAILSIDSDFVAIALPFESLTAYYKFNQGDPGDNIIYDTSGHTRYGYLANGTYNTGGPYGGYLTLNGFSDPGYLPTSCYADGSGSKTLLCVASTDTTAAGFAWIASFGTTTASFFIGRSGGDLILAGAFGDGITASAILSTSTWYAIAGVWDGATASLYVDGILVASSSKSWSYTRLYGRLGDQIDFPFEPWDGDIAQIATFNTALTEEEIIAWSADPFGAMDQGDVGDPLPTGTSSPDNVENLAIWYDLSSPTYVFTDTARTTQVTTAGDIIKGVTDLSGNAYHATNSTSTSTYQTNVINSLSAMLSGNGGIQASFSLNVADNPDTTLVFAIQTPSTTSEQVIFSHDNGGFDKGIEYLGPGTSVGSKIFILNHGTRDLVLDNALLSRNVVLSMTLSNSGLTLVRYNGTTIYKSWGEWGDGQTTLYLGDLNASFNPFLGYISEFAVYDRGISIAEYEAVEEYLYNKYAIGTNGNAALVISSSLAAFASQTIVAIASLTVDTDISANGSLANTAYLTCTSSLSAFSGLIVHSPSFMNVDVFITPKASFTYKGAANLVIDSTCSGRVNAQARIDGLVTLFANAIADRSAISNINCTTNITAIAKVNYSAIAILSSSANLTANATNLDLGVATINIATSLTAIGSVENAHNYANLTIDSNLTARGGLIYAGSANLSSSNSVTAIGTILKLANSNIGISTSVSATASVASTGNADLDIDTALTARAGLAFSGIASLSSGNSLTAVGRITRNAQASLTSNTSITATGTNSKLGVANINISSNITSFGKIAISALANLSATSSIAAMGSNEFLASLDLTIDSSLTADGSYVQFGESDLEIESDLIAVGTSESLQTLDIVATSNMMARGRLTLRGKNTNINITSSISATKFSEVYWNGVSNTWNDPNNWLPIGVPGIGDRAIFSSLSTFNCNINENVNVHWFEIRNDYGSTVNTSTFNVTVTRNFEAYSGDLTNGSGTIQIGQDLYLQNNSVINTSKNWIVARELSILSSLYTQGSGSITLTGSGTNQIDFGSNNIEDLIINTLGMKQLNGACNTDSLTITSGDFDLNGNDLTFDSMGTLINHGILELTGIENITNVILDYTDGKVIYNVTGGLSSFVLGNNYFNLEIR